MSLGNLIKRIHNSSGNPCISAAIERHFMKKANDYDEEVFADKQTRFHPSSITFKGICVRAYYLMMKRDVLGFCLQKPEPHPTSLMRIFEHGHSIHSMYQDKVLGPAGVLYGKWELRGEVCEGFQPSEDWKYVEPRIWWTEKRMSGYCDGFLFLDGKWCVLEIKSTNDQNFRWIKRSGEAKYSHVQQAQLYLEAPHDLEKKPDFAGAVILYINKATGEELDFFVPKNREIIAPLLDKIDEAIDSLEGDVIPERHSDCKTRNSKRAKDCNSCHICFGVDDGR